MSTTDLRGGDRHLSVAKADGTDSMMQRATCLALAVRELPERSVEELVVAAAFLETGAVLVQSFSCEHETSAPAPAPTVTA